MKIENHYLCIEMFYAKGIAYTFLYLAIGYMLYKPNFLFAWYTLKSCGFTKDQLSKVYYVRSELMFVYPLVFILLIILMFFKKSLFKKRIKTSITST